MKRQGAFCQPLEALLHVEASRTLGLGVWCWVVWLVYAMTTKVVSREPQTRRGGARVGSVAWKLAGRRKERRTRAGSAVKRMRKPVPGSRRRRQQQQQQPYRRPR